MTNEQIEQQIKQYIPQVAHMTLATARDNKPRAFEVHFAYDTGLNFYFCSSIEAQHSQDIRENPNVAGTIVMQHEIGQKVRGVYFEGTAEQLDDATEDNPGVVAYDERFGFGPQVVQAAKKEGKARFYKITINQFRFIDGYENNPPKTFLLPWKN
jgi:uncharacterized protein YhbP (UPF0306 family)